MVVGRQAPEEAPGVRVRQHRGQRGAVPASSAEPDSRLIHGRRRRPEDLGKKRSLISAPDPQLFLLVPVKCIFFLNCFTFVHEPPAILFGIASVTADDLEVRVGGEEAPELPVVATAINPEVLVVLHAKDLNDTKLGAIVPGGWGG